MCLISWIYNFYDSFSLLWGHLKMLSTNVQATRGWYLILSPIKRYRLIKHENRDVKCIFEGKSRNRALWPVRHCTAKNLGTTCSAFNSFFHNQKMILNLCWFHIKSSKYKKSFLNMKKNCQMWKTLSHWLFAVYELKFLGVCERHSKNWFMSCIKHTIFQCSPWS